MNVTMNKAGRDYALQFGGAMAAYVAVLVVALTAIENFHLTGVARPLVGVTPVIPAIFALLAFLRFLGRMDELQRRIQFEAFGFSFGATAILTFVYGFLELSGSLPYVSVIWILPLMVALWGVGLAIASWRYR